MDRAQDAIQTRNRSRLVVEGDVAGEGKPFGLAQLEGQHSLVLVQEIRFRAAERALNHGDVASRVNQRLGGERINPSRRVTELDGVARLVGLDLDRDMIIRACAIPQCTDPMTAIRRRRIHATNRAITDKPNRIQESRLSGSVGSKEDVDWVKLEFNVR